MLGTPDLRAARVESTQHNDEIAGRREALQHWAGKQKHAAGSEFGTNSSSPRSTGRAREGSDTGAIVVPESLYLWQPTARIDLSRLGSTWAIQRVRREGGA